MPRIILASNRLPVTLHPGRKEEDGGEVAESSGGLVSAFRRVAEEITEEVVWIGWPGCSVANEEEEKRLTQVLADRSTNIKLVPVWLSPSDVEDFYDGFSNSSLWPLLHWMSNRARFKRAWADSYRRVNEQFADAILLEAEVTDLVWIQDYHLFFVPQLLRTKQAQNSARCLSVSEAHDSEKPHELPTVGEDSCHFGEFKSPRENGEDLPTRESSSSSTFRPPPRSRNLLEECLMRQTSDEGPNHLDLCAQLSQTREIRKHQGPKLKIAFFLHTPFPPHEVITILPQGQDIVEGLLGADLVGFHTYSYLRHYRSCVVRLCGLTTEIDHIDHKGQRTRLAVFPIGANWQDFSEAIKRKEFATYLEEYTQQFQGKSLVLSVERLDYSKGIPQRLDAIKRYLEIAHAIAKNPEAEPEVREERRELLQGLQTRFKKIQDPESRPTWGHQMRSSIHKSWKGLWSGSDELEKEVVDHTKTVFLFIAVPSRQTVEEYKLIEQEVHMTISTINGQFSTPTHQPIVYIHRGVTTEELAALYARADCCLVTPLIDGMNLVAKEYVAVKDPDVKQAVPGVLVLSELAGAAQELFDSIVVNPYDEDAVASAIAVGLELISGGYLSPEKQWEVCGRMRQHVMTCDAVFWAKSVLKALQEPVDTNSPTPQESFTQPLIQKHAVPFFAVNPNAKALFLDYDGTLREFVMRPEEAVPSTEAMAIFAGLDKREDLHVYIVSGRTQDFLDEHFGAYKSFTIIAEHGYQKRGPDTNHEWRSCSPHATTDWMEKVKPVMELFSRATPGSHIEEKSSCIVWHYRESDEEFGAFKAKELMHQLAMSLGNLPCRISQGKKIVEVASLEVKKGTIVASACQEREDEGTPFDEILCIGDDQTDESMFLDAPKTSFTVKVGPGETHARYRVDTPEKVREFLSYVVEQRLPLVLPMTASSRGMSQQSLTSSSSRTQEVPGENETQEVGHGKFHSCVEIPLASSVGRNRSAESLDNGEDPLACLPEFETEETPQTS